MITGRPYEKALTEWFSTGGPLRGTFQRDPSPPAFHRKGLRKDRKDFTGAGFLTGRPLRGALTGRPYGFLRGGRLRGGLPKRPLEWFFTGGSLWGDLPEKAYVRTRRPLRGGITGRPLQGDPYGGPRQGDPTGPYVTGKPLRRGPKRPT